MYENNNHNSNSLDFVNNEEINNDKKENSFKVQSEPKTTKNKNSHAFQYISYLSIILSIYIFFFINYLKTNNWYEENTHYINLRPLSICENYIKTFKNCLNQSQKSTSIVIKDGDKYIFDTKIICKEHNDKLQGCFDHVHEFSKKCQLYLNELYICKNKYGKEIKKCLNSNLINCLRGYNLINITKVFEYL